MKNMKIRQFAWLAVAGLAFGGGCVSIPAGKQTFYTEYPSEVWVIEGQTPSKTHLPEPAVSTRDIAKGAVSVGLSGTVQFTWQREQHYDGVKVVKSKRLAIGFMPGHAEWILRPKTSLQPLVMWQYEGDGKYSIQYSNKDFQGEAIVGLFLAPVSLLVAPFLPFECESHHWGRAAKPDVTVHPDADRSGIPESNWLAKFPEKDRQEMGAWIWSDEQEHPHRAGLSGITHLGLVGCHKYCTYVVLGPKMLEKTTPADPEIVRRNRFVRGPYAVTLFLPGIGYEETREVAPGRTDAAFSAAALFQEASGQTSVEGTLRFRPPPGGLEDVPDEDDRGVLEQAMLREWPVRFDLSGAGEAVRGGDSPSPQGEEASSLPLYSLGDPQHLSGGKLRVRVEVEDPAMIFRIDRQVQPKVRRLFREQVATGADAGRPESVRWATENEGKTMVYTVEFADEPTVEGWSLNPATKKGVVRLRIPVEMSAETAKQRARAHIEEIVREQGGGMGGSGAYRSLEETLENGVLAVEFELVE